MGNLLATNWGGGGEGHWWNFAFHLSQGAILALAILTSPKNILTSRIDNSSSVFKFPKKLYFASIRNL